MKNRRNVAITAAVAAVLSAPLVIGPYTAARADELSDLRANQELLQRRLDQLAQAQNVGSGAYLGASTGGPVTVQMMGGSFPRSFLIPGTDTSIRVGGEIRVYTLYWFTGGDTNKAHDTNGGSTGNLGDMPLSHSGAAAARGHGVFDLSPEQSKVGFETRTPTAMGEARTFMQFDWSNDLTGNRLFALSDSIAPRLRYAYGTLGGFLAGQANSNFTDPDASMEVISFSGPAGGPDPSRIPQLRYTVPLTPYGILGALSVSAEQPDPGWWSPGSGVVGVFGVASAGNPLKAASPDLTAAWYIPQPWGHMDFSVVVNPTMTAKDGLFVDRTFTGYGGHLSGDVKPHWFGWDKDYIAWHFDAGDGVGTHVGVGSSLGGLNLISNYTTALAATAAGAKSIIVKPVRAYGVNLAYQHWWSPTWHSNIGFGWYEEDINGLNGAVCNGGGSAAARTARTTGAAGCNLNKNEFDPIVNLFWTPLPFVDVAFEYIYGLRRTVGNQVGHENVIENRFRIRF